MNIREAIAKLKQLRHELYFHNEDDPAIPAINTVLSELTELNRPDGFWCDDDPDESYDSVPESLDQASVGAVVKIGQFHRLPYIWAVVYRNDEGDNASEEFASEEEAKVWKAKHFPEESSE